MKLFFVFTIVIYICVLYIVRQIFCIHYIFIMFFMTNVSTVFTCYVRCNEIILFVACFVMFVEILMCHVTVADCIHLMFCRVWCIFFVFVFLIFSSISECIRHWFRYESIMIITVAQYMQKTNTIAFLYQWWVNSYILFTQQFWYPSFSYHIHFSDEHTIDWKVISNNCFIKHRNTIVENDDTFKDSYEIWIYLCLPRCKCKTQKSHYYYIILFIYPIQQSLYSKMCKQNVPKWRFYMFFYLFLVVCENVSPI